MKSTRTWSRNPGIRSWIAGALLGAVLAAPWAGAEVPTLVLYDNLADPAVTLSFAGQNGQEARDDLHGVLSGPLYRVTFDYLEPSGDPGTFSVTANVLDNPGGSDINSIQVWGPRIVSGLLRGRQRFAVITPPYPQVGPDLWFGVRFSVPTAGLIIREIPSVGSSHDLYSSNGGLFNFLGNPLANFAMRVEVVDCPGSGPVYVDDSAAGAGDGTSWFDAFPDLQDALVVAEACDSVNEIWVAAGTYLPSASGDRDATFRLPPGVSVYGGFAGFENLLSERDWEANPTVLSGDLGTPGDPGDNSRHVVTLDPATGPSAVLDGFHVTAGNAGLASGAHGGGIDGTGGGSPVLRNLRVENNIAHSGAGLAVVGGAPELTGLRFEANQGVTGGAVYWSGGSGRLEFSVLRANLADSSGGGIHLEGGELILVNDILDGNMAGIAGGGLFLRDAASTLVHLTLYDNQAALPGPALHCEGASLVDVWNSILWADAGPGPEIVSPGAGFVTFHHSLVQGSGASSGRWDPLLGNDGGGNRSLDPRFENPGAGDLRVRYYSPAVNGGANAAPFVPPFDLVGIPRPIADFVDMGAYEYPQVVGVGDPATVVAGFLRVMPNPLRSRGRVGFRLGAAGEVRLDLFDVRGRRVATPLAPVFLDAGVHEFEIGEGLPEGVFFLRLQAEGTVRTERLVVLR